MPIDGAGYPHRLGRDGLLNWASWRRRRPDIRDSRIARRDQERGCLSSDWRGRLDRVGCRMNLRTTDLPGVLILEPRRFCDDRGIFFESFNAGTFARAGLPTQFAQDNVSYSAPNVLRGLHYQLPNAQGKLVSVLRGEVFDVVVDIRIGSPTFGKWIGTTLSFENGRQLLFRRVSPTASWSRATAPLPL